MYIHSYVCMYKLRLGWSKSTIEKCTYRIISLSGKLDISNPVRVYCTIIHYDPDKKTIPQRQQWPRPMYELLGPLVDCQVDWPSCSLCAMSMVTCQLAWITSAIQKAYEYRKLWPNVNNGSVMLSVKATKFIQQPGKMRKTIQSEIRWSTLVFC